LVSRERDCQNGNDGGNSDLSKAEKGEVTAITSRDEVHSGASCKLRDPHPNMGGLQKGEGFIKKPKKPSELGGGVRGSSWSGKGVEANKESGKEGSEKKQRKGGEAPSREGLDEGFTKGKKVQRYDSWQVTAQKGLATRGNTRTVFFRSGGTSIPKGAGNTPRERICLRALLICFRNGSVRRSKEETPANPHKNTIH